ncbi:MAG: putative motility protein [Lachnospiraceae bacterium]|nr:putative motility protein [Lachnospiraceae bacterium]
MDIAGLSMAMSASQVNSAFGVAMLSKSLDAASTAGDQITSMIDAAAMERSVNPAVGANFDMYI